MNTDSGESKSLTSNERFTLLPCPFCGAPAREQDNWRGHYGCSDVNCDAYHAALSFDQWNRRPTPPRDSRPCRGCEQKIPWDWAFCAWCGFDNDRPESPTYAASHYTAGMPLPDCDQCGSPAADHIPLFHGPCPPQLIAKASSSIQPETTDPQRKRIEDENREFVAQVAFRRGVTLGHLRDEGGCELREIMRKLDAACSQQEPPCSSEPEAWLFHCWTPGCHATFSTVDPEDKSWWPTNKWKGVTRVALVTSGTPELIHGELPPSERIQLKA